jgi:TnpA family transposase
MGPLSPRAAQEKALRSINLSVINSPSFYTKVINTNARDVVHVIDGLLHHETDLAIEEHYTDTAGYTDQVFGARSNQHKDYSGRL